MAKVRTGSVVAAGDHLATVIPLAELKVVAGFPPSAALARVRRGQPAQLRLDGFPWTEFGSLGSEVTWVSGEARDGKLWVDGSVASGSESAIPLQHGMREPWWWRSSASRLRSWCCGPRGVRSPPALAPGATGEGRDFESGETEAPLPSS